MALVIVGLVSNKHKIQSLKLVGSLSTIAYMLTTGDINMMNFNPTGTVALENYNKALEAIGDRSFSELNDDYKKASELINALESFKNKLKHD